MGSYAILLMLLVSVNPDADAAYADRATLPLADQPYAFYLSLSSQRSPAAKERLVKVVRSTLPSLSSRSYLGDQLPVRVGDNLLRIDSRGYGWEKSLPQVLYQHYPYRPELRSQKLYAYTFRADWFVASVTDPIQTGDSQYRLLYGDKQPKTSGEFRKFWGANTDPNFLYQFHEAASQVGVNPDRNVKQFDTNQRGSLYATEDSENTVGEKDPGNYGKNGKFDAGEEIAMTPVQYAGESGLKMVFGLFNGKGERQDFAPARIVTDHKQIRSSEIRNDVSCRVCHVEGLRPLNVNGFKAFIEQGSRVAADKKTQQLIDQQYQSGMAQQIEADNRLYAKYLDMTSGYTPAEYAKAFEATVRGYDAPVTREQAARELYMADEEFRLALGYYSAKYGLTRRLADLSEGGSISRAQWVAEYELAQVVKHKWGAK
jgi:hypothetical protein